MSTTHSLVRTPCWRQVQPLMQGHTFSHGLGMVIRGHLTSTLSHTKGEAWPRWVAQMDDLYQTKWVSEYFKQNNKRNHHTWSIYDESRGFQTPWKVQQDNQHIIHMTLSTQTHQIVHNKFNYLKHVATSLCTFMYSTFNSTWENCKVRHNILANARMTIFNKWYLKWVG